MDPIADSMIKFYVYGKTKPKGWDDLASRVEKYANLMWANNYGVMSRLIAEPNPMLRQFVIQELCQVASFSDAHKLVALGVAAAAKEEKMTGRPLWTSPEDAVETAYHYGKVLADAYNYSGYVNDVVARGAAPDLSGGTRAQFEVNLARETEVFGAKLDALRESGAPFPSAAAVIEAMKERMPPLEESMYATLAILIDDKRPSFSFGKALPGKSP